MLTLILALLIILGGYELLYKLIVWFVSRIV